MTERTICDLCGSTYSDWEILFHKYDFTFVKCSKCGFVFTKEIPTAKELEIAYSEKYFNGSIYDNYTEKLYDRRKDYVSYLSYIQSLTGLYRGKILEVGSATGDFLDAANFLGYDAYGIEISAWAANVAKSKGHKIYNISIENIEQTELKNISFDCLFMWDVFEHLSFPNKVIQKVKSYLNTKGIVVIHTLNIGSPTVKFLGSKW